MPKFLYTVPVRHPEFPVSLPLTLSISQFGCNPTGMTASDDRRREVLELARKYNFLILEGARRFIQSLTSSN